MSKRGYLTTSELEEYADVTVTDADEAEDQISQAEELIDAYVGFQTQALPNTIVGLGSGGSTTTLNLQTKHQNIYEKNYFVLCMVEIVGGTGKGERHMCTASTKAGVLTVDTFTATLDNTSYYKIWQLGKFPRMVFDAIYDSENSPNTWYKSIPEEVKRATAAQVEYRIQMGDDFFSTNKVNMKRERIGDYSYEKYGEDIGRLEDLIAPKAKMLLRGIRNIKGAIID